VTDAEPPAALIAAGAVRPTTHFGPPGPVTDVVDVEPQAEAMAAAISTEQKGWQISRGNRGKKPIERA
jgi:hypothetical protein